MTSKTAARDALIRVIDANIWEAQKAGFIGLANTLSNCKESLAIAEAEMAEVRAELHEYRELFEVETMVSDGYRAERDELRAELERVKKDSDRLDFLLNKQAYVATGLHGSWVHFICEDSWQAESYAEPRDAIDAAIGAGEGEAG